MATSPPVVLQPTNTYTTQQLQQQNCIPTIPGILLLLLLLLPSGLTSMGRPLPFGPNNGPALGAAVALLAQRPVGPTPTPIVLPARRRRVHLAPVGVEAVLVGEQHVAAVAPAGGCARLPLAWEADAEPVARRTAGRTAARMCAPLHPPLTVRAPLLALTMVMMMMMMMMIVMKTKLT